MTTNTKLAMDQCARCTVRGDMDACRATPCNVRTSWFTQEAEATHLRELAAYRLTVENMEREIAAQQPAQSSAAADTVVLEAALRAIHQAIDLIGEPDTERLRTVRRVLRGAVVVAEDCKAPQADTQPAPAQQCAYSIDADQQGIRARVADAITGVLAFGAQGTNQPPSGHWLAPFWNAAKADSVLEDAARYRLVRRGQHWSVIDGIGNDLRAEALDAAIDAALAAKKGETT